MKTKSLLMYRRGLWQLTKKFTRIRTDIRFQTSFHTTNLSKWISLIFMNNSLAVTFFANVWTVILFRLLISLKQRSNFSRKIASVKMPFLLTRKNTFEHYSNLHWFWQLRKIQHNLKNLLAKHINVQIVNKSHQET